MIDVYSYFRNDGEDSLFYLLILTLMNIKFFNENLVYFSAGCSLKVFVR